MPKHLRAFAAVFPILLRQGATGRQVLLHRRQNTGYMDGLWDIAGSGHVDEGETATQAATRECAEEIGVAVRADDLAFAHLSHRVGVRGVRTYFDVYFLASAFDGEPTVMEPEKCSELRWFDLDQLPEDMIDVRKTALRHCLAGSFYGEAFNPHP